MANVSYRVTMRPKWWLPFYFKAASSYIWCAAPFYDEDDPRLDRFIERSAEFIGKHGYTMRSELVSEKPV